MEIGSADPRPLVAERPSRRAAEILEVLDAHPVPVTALDVFADLRRAGLRTGLATVYRVLHALEGAPLTGRGTVHAIRRADEAAYRICSTTHHDHLVCPQCGTVHETARQELEQWLAATAPSGWHSVPSPQQIGMVCPRCK